MSIQVDATAGWDVAVVGAGPTGLLLAGELAEAGVRAVVLERAERPSPAPRANGVVGRGAVELRRRGVLRGTGLRVLRPPRYRFGPLTLRLGLLRNPLHVLPVPQQRLEELLADRAARLGATILRGHEVVDLDQDDDGVTVRVTGQDGGTAIRAAYLAGCDGAHSPVRKRLGIAFPGATAPDIARMARVTIPSATVARDRSRIDVPGIGPLVPFRSNRTAHGSLTISPVRALDRSAPHDLYLVSTHEPRDGAEPADDLDVGELRASFRRVLGDDLPFTAATSVRSVVGHTRQAERYRHGRVFLAGDAAHVFAAGGAAINAGVLDAIALGETLVRALGGDAALGSDAVLDAYEQQRRPAGRRTLEHTLVQVALETGDDQGDAARLVVGELLRHRGAARRLARLLEE